jgi:heme exporter protein C
MTEEKALRLARIGLGVTIVALIALVGIYVRALAFTPIEINQGAAQKIFYVHVPSAWSALLAFSVTGILSILYLWLKDARIDLVAASSAEVGVAFSVAMLTTGPIWGKPIWGTWWTWDARLTSTLFIFLLFVGYLVLRGVVVDPGLRARFSSVIGIMGLVLVPFIHLTVYMFRTLHPDPIVLKPSAPSLPSEMLLTLMLSLGTFTLLYVGFLMQRYGLGLLRDLREREAALDA